MNYNSIKMHDIVYLQFCYLVYTCKYDICVCVDRDYCHTQNMLHQLALDDL